jgi:hypothetical protein
MNGIYQIYKKNRRNRGVEVLFFVSIPLTAKGHKWPGNQGQGKNQADEIIPEYSFG